MNNNKKSLKYILYIYIYSIYRYMCVPWSSMHFWRLKSAKTATCLSSETALKVNFRLSFGNPSWTMHARSFSRRSPRLTFNQTVSDSRLSFTSSEMSSDRAMAGRNELSAESFPTASIMSPGNGMLSSHSSRISCFTFFTQTSFRVSHDIFCFLEN